MYKEIDGDLLDLFDEGEFEVIAHGCNCQGAMGAGIAAQIARRYPSAYYADQYYELPQDFQRLGNFSTNISNDIFNLYTQVHGGPSANLIAIRACLIKLAMALPKTTPMFPFRIGLPQIGCGIGGLEWEDVREIIIEELKDHEVTVVIWDK